MIKKNLVQFSVVREDPQIEMRLVQDFGFEKAVLIGSGGCTAFCLKSFRPELKTTLIEPNPAQVVLIKEKAKFFQSNEKERILKQFGVENFTSESLIERGNFESLFRQFRAFINEFVVSEKEIENAFLRNSAEIWCEIFQNSYWKTAFDLFFSDSILKTMFGPAAIQHAPKKNSYPQYFRERLEKGLLKSDISKNYFLHHIFLGRYFAENDAMPFYLVNFPQNFEFEFFEGFAQNFKSYDDRSLVHFSNIFDWCEQEIVKKIAENAAEGLETGSVVTFRQLNNKENYRSLFGEKFRWLETSEIVENDRSLFYEKIEIGEKIL